MKKITAVFVIFTLIFCFASCGKSKQYKKIGETPTLAGNSPSAEDIGEGVTESTDEESTDDGMKQDEFATPITTERPSLPSATRPSTTKPAPSKSPTTTTTAPTEEPSEITTVEPPTAAIRPTETTTLEKLDETETESNLPESNSDENAE
ncbi:MAG: hypothetical protein J1F24_03155 [Oscillospiraceae bacterium]|nr:hypothetical protein [Oscillospiraceae bacterium]